MAIRNVFKMDVVPYMVEYRLREYEDVIEENIDYLRGHDDFEYRIKSALGPKRGETILEIIFEALYIVDLKRVVVSAANRLSDGTLLLGVRHWDDLMRNQLKLYQMAYGIGDSGHEEDDISYRDIYGAVEQGRRTAPLIERFYHNIYGL